jgi:hypothetical protein
VVVVLAAVVVEVVVLESCVILLSRYRAGYTNVWLVVFVVVWPGRCGAANACGSATAARRRMLASMVSTERRRGIGALRET